MSTLKLSKTVLPLGAKDDQATFEDVGTVEVRPDGTLDTANVTDPTLVRFLEEDLRVTASMRGGAVPASDPDYPLAVADSIGRGTLWRYTAEPV